MSNRLGEQEKPTLAAQLSREARSKRPIFIKFQFVRKMQQRPEVARLPIKIKVWPFVLRVASPTQNNIRKHGEF